MTVQISSVDIESELLYAAREVLTEELNDILKPFSAYQNSGISRQHSENVIKVWLSYKHKLGLIGDYVVRCDVFGNIPMIGNDPESVVDNIRDKIMVIDVAVRFRLPREEDGSESRPSPYVFIPLRVNFDR